MRIYDRAHPGQGNPVPTGEEEEREEDQVGRHGAGPGPSVPPKLNGIGALIEESQALKQILCDAFHRGALKRHRQQSKPFRAALTSLKQLQQIDA